MASSSPKPRQLTLPDGPEPITAAKASALCKQRAKLDADRLEHGRLADAKRKMIEAIDTELEIYVDSQKSGKVRSVVVGKWRLSIVQVPKGLYYLGELVKAIGQAKFDKLKAAAGTKDKLEVEAIP